MPCRVGRQRLGFRVPDGRPFRGSGLLCVGRAVWAVRVCLMGDHSGAVVCRVGRAVWAVPCGQTAFA